MRRVALGRPVFVHQGVHLIVLDLFVDGENVVAAVVVVPCHNPAAGYFQLLTVFNKNEIN